MLRDALKNTFIYLAAAVVVPSLVTAEEIRSGSYTDGGSTLVVDGTLVGITIRQPGCLGELDGQLAQNNLGDWFVLGIDEPQCVLSVDQEGPFSLVIKQHENCSFYHGAACGFSGYYRRTN